MTSSGTSAAAPTVSVLIPSFNGARFIAQAVESVLQQTCPDFELVIVDDHSSDKTVEIVSAFADPRIRLLRNKVNLGFGANWNACLAEARGECIKLLPQDDVLAPECLARQLAVLRADTVGALAMTFCARNIIRPDGTVLMRRSAGSKHRLNSRAEILRRTFRWGTNPIGEPGGVLFRRSAALEAGPFDGRRPFVIDIDYWLRLLEHGDAVYTPEPLCSFRVSCQSQSVRMLGMQARQFGDFLAELGKRDPTAVSFGDRLAGRVMSAMNACARAAIYRAAMHRDRRG